MSIQADIDATVTAFVSGLAELVRQVALETAERVFADQRSARSAPSAPHAARAPQAPRPAAKPKPKAAPAVQTARAAQGSAPAPAAAPLTPPPRSLKDPRRGRLITVPSTPPPPFEPPMPVVVKVPAKMPRKPRTPRAISPTPPAPVAAEPQPARNWVVRRRTPAEARERQPGSEVPAGDGAPPAAATATEANGAAPVVRPESV